MTVRCPNCNDTARTVETRQLTTGQRRRRLQCRSCRYRWSEWSELPTSGPSCHSCQHWHETQRCDLGLPDPLQEGPQFAADCSLFAEVV